MLKIFFVALFFLLINLVYLNESWPGMKKLQSEIIPLNINNNLYNNNNNINKIWNNASVIGPRCTVGAHNDFDILPCPNRPQPTSQANYEAYNYSYPMNFIMNWTMYFIPDANDVPPYNNNIPNTPYNITYGTTYYDINYENGAMKESYYERCIPVFPSGSLSQTNNYSCDFITLNNNNTAYVIFHDDRPIDAPKCCIIGQPFHVPPRDFAKGLTVKFQSIINNTLVDWNAIWLLGPGIFNYGFRHDSPKDYGIPYVFYMQGIPTVATWCYQHFYDFNVVKPPTDTWVIPQDCYEAQACPGWEPHKATPI